MRKKAHDLKKRPLISLHNFCRPTAKSRQTRPNSPKRIKPNEIAMPQSIDYACNFFDPVSNLLKRVISHPPDPPWDIFGQMIS